MIRIKPTRSDRACLQVAAPFSEVKEADSVALKIEEAGASKKKSKK